MEEMLAKFQADLGSISSEIQSLQEQSLEMNLKLQNRQAVRGELSQFVDDMVIPQLMIKSATLGCFGQNLTKCFNLPKAALVFVHGQ